MGKPQMSDWTRGAKHGWKAVHKVRQDSAGDVVEESYTERTSYLYATLYVLACAVGWWWQTELDGWVRAIVLVATVVLSIYIVVMLAALGLMTLAARFIRKV
jgi:hypothetical protein